MAVLTAEGDLTDSEAPGSCLPARHLFCRNECQMHSGALVPTDTICSQGDGELRAIDVAMAACAAPAYFPSMRVGRRIDADGGLFAAGPDPVALSATRCRLVARRPLERMLVPLPGFHERRAYLILPSAIRNASSFAS